MRMPRAFYSGFMLLCIVNPCMSLFSSSSSLHLVGPPRELPTQPVDENFSWEKRRTGTSPEWKAHLGWWKHLNATDPTKMEVWTEGRILKCLRQVNDDAFELHSVYEPSACGLWAKALIKQRDCDGQFELGHTFRRTPWRAIHLHQESLPKGWDAAADVSRAIIVRPDAATFSGTMWLPSVQQASNVEQGASRMQFAEMWLAESVNGHPEAIKYGMFVQYDGVTGEMLQCFRMNEIALRDGERVDPTLPINFDLVEDCIVRPDANDDMSASLKVALQSGLPIETVLRDGGLSFGNARVVRLVEGVDGPEEAWELNQNGLPYYSPAELDSDASLYWDLRFDDGVYVRIPRRFDHALSGEVCMEIGCVKRNGAIQRLMAWGNRSAGGFRTFVHEEWIPKLGLA